MKNKIITLAISFICFIICFTICFGIGYKKGKSSIEIQKDTTVIEKVITQYRPAYKAEQPLGFQKITIPAYFILPEYVTLSNSVIIFCAFMILLLDSSIFLFSIAIIAILQNLIIPSYIIKTSLAGEAVSMLF